MKKQFSYNVDCKNVDNVDQDQTAQNVQSDLYLHCPQKHLVSSSVRKDITSPSRLHVFQSYSGNKTDLTLSQTTNFRLVQTERVCRRQF